MRNKQLSRGFTIVELLIVVVIIGILAALVITAWNGITQRAKDSSLASDKAQAKKQIEAFYAVNGSYPTANNCTNTAATEICLKTSPGNTLTYTFNGNAASPPYTLNGVSGFIAINATGGTVTETGGYRIHTFTSSGTFSVSNIGSDKTVDYLIVGGGGGGGNAFAVTNFPGGGGGGTKTGSMTLSATGSYAVTVGNGGAADTAGSASSFNGISANGGGAANAGGASGNGYGNGGAPYGSGSGGGGAGGAGSGMNGGPGISSSITGSAAYYGGGGGGAASGIGGSGGGGYGMFNSQGYSATAGAGSANTGGGGGGAGTSWVSQYGGPGGSGVVIIRYPI